MAMAMALSRSSAAASTLTKRCLSSTISRRCNRLPAGSGSLSSIGVTPASAVSAQNASFCNAQQNIRSFSAMPPPPTAAPPDGGANNGGIQPPTSLTPDAGLGAQDAMKLFIQHGLGKQKLRQIAAEKATAPLVDRWQKMVATYLETQCHVISLLGYRPDERGIALYTQHLSQALQLSNPEIQERLRVAGRDTYRMVLGAAFDVPSLVDDAEKKGELSVVDARNIMHKVSMRMQEPEVLEKVAKRCGASVALNDGHEAQQIELARKHTVVQQVMVTDVYLTEEGEGKVSLVQECGFGEGEDGYVRMQSAMAEHQGDPLITQYVGAAMVKLLQSAGIDMEALQKQAQEAQASESLFIQKTA